jgi:hypothetical protein
MMSKRKSQMEERRHEHMHSHPSSAATSPKNHESIAILACRPGVEDEKCVVSQYRTSSEQRQKFHDHLNHHSGNRIPIEWVIDIADESSGWFYATAYHFNDLTNMIHVMVPDKNNPTFDGEVPLDHRTVHLVECVDGNTDALFNRIVRDSVLKVKWDLEWFEEDPESHDDTNGEAPGRWIQSFARYYIRIANQILVEDGDSEEGVRGYVMLVADSNIRLLHCYKGKGLDDFSRLIQEGIVQSRVDAIENSESTSNRLPSVDDLDLGMIYGQKPASKPPLAHGNKPTSSAPLSPVEMHSVHGSDHSQSFSSQELNNLRKLTEMAKGLKECLGDLLDERDDQSNQLQEIAKAFKSFALNGDLTAGLRLNEKIDKILTRKGGNHDNHETGSSHTDEVNYDAIADDAWKLSNKLERGLLKHHKSQSEHLLNGASSKEVDHLKRMVNKMQQQLDDRDEEIRSLRSNHRMR